MLAKRAMSLVQIASLILTVLMAIQVTKIADSASQHVTHLKDAIQQNKIVADKNEKDIRQLHNQLSRIEILVKKQGM